MSPAHRSFAVPSGNIFGVKLCIFSVFSFFYRFWNISFCYSLLFLLSFSIFLFFSSYPSLLISSYSSRRCYSSSSYSSFFDRFGVKFMYIAVRPYVLTIYVLFFFINIMSPAPPIAASLILTALY